MSSRSFPTDNNSPTACFQRFCQAMLDGNSKDLTKNNIEDFRVILHMIMHECSKANIETGKIWVFEHCHSPTHTTAILEYILSLSSICKGQEERIHMIYLVNDILFHTARKQLPWMRDAMLPLLTPLLKLAYEAAESAEYKAKVIKVITFWGDLNIFESSVICNIRQAVSPYKIVDTFQHQQQQPYELYPLSTRYQQLPFQQQHSSFNQHQQQQAPTQRMQPYMPSLPQASAIQQTTPPPSIKQYFELPAGLMLFAKNQDYKPIDPALVKLPFPRPLPSKEIALAVDDFYTGLSLSNEDDSLLEEKDVAKSHVDAQGWEKGFLDSHFESFSQKNKEQDRYAQQPESNRGRSQSRDTYERGYSIHHSRSRSPVRHRRRSYSRSRSPPSRRRSPPRGRSPMNRRDSPPGRGRSPPRRSSPPGRSRSPPRRSSPPRSSYRQRRYSRSRSPPSAFQQSGYGSSRGAAADFGGAPENRYLGLGNAPDEFDSFRRNKSQAYSRREPHQPITCYKCNKIGHLARECNSL